MAIVTDFTRFFDDSGIQSTVQAEALKQSIEWEADVGMFKTKRKGAQLFVLASGSETILRLANEVEKATFLEIIGERYEIRQDTLN